MVKVGMCQDSVISLLMFMIIIEAIFIKLITTHILALSI